MARIRLDTNAISDWPSFHEECRRALGFPDFYGANMDAWIDCLSYLRDPAAGMSAVALGPDEALEIEIPDAEVFRRRVPEIAAALWDCTAFVNRRYTSDDERAPLVLVPVDR